MSVFTKLFPTDKSRAHELALGRQDLNADRIENSEILGAQETSQVVSTNNANASVYASQAQTAAATSGINDPNVQVAVGASLLLGVVAWKKGWLN